MHHPKLYLVTWSANVYVLLNNLYTPSLSAADWLQGPYVYALYEHYGMTPHQIEQLFVGGFGSSMIFGTVVGSFADKLWVSIFFAKLLFLLSTNFPPYCIYYSLTLKMLNYSLH